MKKTDLAKAERRKYLRLDTVFPVAFRLLGLGNAEYLSDWLQGFTNNVGKGGICLEIFNLNNELALILQNKSAKLELKLELPLAKRAISAIATVAWVKQIDLREKRYLIGLSYEQIDRRQNNWFVRYAWMKKVLFPTAVTLVIIFALLIAVNSYVSMKLIKGNKALVDQLINIVQESSIAKQKVKRINKEKEDLELKIDALQIQMQATSEEKALMGENIKDEKAKDSKKINALNFLAERLSKERGLLQEQLIALQQKESVITQDLLHMDKKKVVLEKANLDNMYKWLKIHQNLRTGLVASFEGDKDISGWAFTYDQSLLVIVYSYFSDFLRAKKILDFFAQSAQTKDGMYLNAYYVNDGSAAEYTVHSGPNIWLGLAVMQYTKKSKDTTYLDLAKEIAGQIMTLQAADPEGGIKGGPSTKWFSTEHNLDAYAFFDMLYKYTGSTQYLSARDKVMNWIVENTYSKSDIPIKRGKGDGTIATDTYAWSIAAVGPEKLLGLGMNPDRILEFAEQNCSVEADFSRPEGKSIKIKGFDFAPERNTARGGVVSSEWTAQMVLAYKIMSEFYYKKEMIAKARAYAFKADDYLSSLSNMIISSPSASGQGESCLPYATQDFVDTGHGWMTPKGANTGSVSGTAYTIFAYCGFNPLELRD